MDSCNRLQIFERFRPACRIGLEGIVSKRKDANHLRVMIEKKRKWNNYWDWPDRSVKERGIAGGILRQSGVQVTRLTSRAPGQDPPDCEAELDGHFSGVEVTELVD